MAEVSAPLQGTPALGAPRSTCIARHPHAASPPGVGRRSGTVDLCCQPRTGQRRRDVRGGQGTSTASRAAIRLATTTACGRPRLAPGPHDSGCPGSRLHPPGHRQPGRGCRSREHVGSPAQDRNGRRLQTPERGQHVADRLHPGADYRHRNGAERGQRSAARPGCCGPGGHRRDARVEHPDAGTVGDQ